MAAAITRITPGRGRAGDSITIEGSGFSAAAGRNSVTVGGVAATVTAESATSITATMPAGIATDKHLDVTVANLTDATTSNAFRWWSKASLATLRTLRLAATLHGAIERDEGGSTAQRPRIAEARDWERALTLLECLPFDVLSAKGRVMARATDGAVSVAAGTAGQRYTRDVTTTGGAFRTRQTRSFHWGRALATTDTAEVLLSANGRDTISAATGDYHAAVAACRLAKVMIGCRRSSPTGSDVTRVRVFKNGSAAWDSNDLATIDRPDVRQGEAWAAYPWLSLAAGDRIAVAVTKDNGTSEMNVFAHAVVL